MTTDTSREAVLSPVRDTMKRPRRVRQHSIRGLTNHIHRQRNHVMVEANTSVYLYFDSDGILIYVGVTGRGIARQREHERDKPWWAYTARQEIEHYETRAQALDRERFLIVTMCPPFNTVHNGDVLVRDAYLRLRAEAENLPTEAPRKRISLRIAVQDAAHIIAITRMEDASIAASIEVNADFVLAASGRSTNSVKLRRIGSAIALSLAVREATDFTSVSLMYKHAEFGRQIKRIDLNTERKGQAAA